MFIRLEPSSIVPLLWPASLPIANFILQLAFPHFIRFGGNLPLKLRYSCLHKLRALISSVSQIAFVRLAVSI